MSLNRLTRARPAAAAGGRDPGCRRGQPSRRSAAVARRRTSAIPPYRTLRSSSSRCRADGAGVVGQVREQRPPVAPIVLAGRLGEHLVAGAGGHAGNPLTTSSSSPAVCCGLDSSFTPRFVYDQHERRPPLAEKFPGTAFPGPLMATARRIKRLKPLDRRPAVVFWRRMNATVMKCARDRWRSASKGGDERMVVAVDALPDPQGRGCVDAQSGVHRHHDASRTTSTGWWKWLPCPAPRRTLRGRRRRLRIHPGPAAVTGVALDRGVEGSFEWLGFVLGIAIGSRRSYARRGRVRCARGRFRVQSARKCS